MYRKAFFYYALATLLVAMQFLMFIKGSAVLQVMDAAGWAFFLTSCLSHAAVVMLVPPVVLFLPLMLLKRRKAAATLLVASGMLISVLVFLDMQVYNLYRFHINGFVLNMVVGQNATEVFAFDLLLYLKEFALFAFFIVLHLLLWAVASRWSHRCHRRQLLTIVLTLIAATLFAHGYHVYASFLQRPSVIKSRRLLPYYFPTTAYKFMLRHVGCDPVATASSPSSLTTQSATSGDICYPLQPIQAQPLQEKPNIVLILIDSWNRRSLTPSCMPNIYRYAHESQWFQNHVSCSNGTRSAVFGMFFSLPSYYWDLFEANHASPVFIDEMLRQGYNCQIYPGATIQNPPFHRVVFQHIPHLNTATEGATVYDRDRQLTDNFIASLPQHANDRQPFFAMLFYDLAHSYQMPQKLNTRFQPAWPYADYTKLSPSLDPTPYFNLYRNCCYQIDIMVGQVLQALQQHRLHRNTIVIITGDHAQEFNENHKNFWGHNGNFSQWQIAVPLIVHWPDGTQPQQFTHRTTHYDIVPTLMHSALGVTSPDSTYSLGHQLLDTQSRSWHIVGSELNYAFIIDGDTILEKTAEGTLDVTDSCLNPVASYHLNPRQFRQAVDRLNRFMK